MTSNLFKTHSYIQEYYALLYVYISSHIVQIYLIPEQVSICIRKLPLNMFSDIFIFSSEIQFLYNLTRT